MDEATLERLMIDDALGALGPDVRALLEAYVRDQPKELAAWRRVAAAATEAIQPAKGESLPPFPHASVPRFPRIALAAAAALLVGFGIGWEFSPAPPRRAALAIAAPMPQVAAAGVTDFFSSSRLVGVALDAERRAPSGPRMGWSLNDFLNSRDHQ
ncbi:MAG TPA: hypothetical protein VL992_07250 [Tepidisphaeraceae bacterium]|nr:hypothetical protein [Tepidisphaeraceae bacterium]